MRTSSDLMLIMEPEADSKALLCAAAERLGCEHIETDSIEGLRDVLALRRPTLAVVSIDSLDANYIAVLDMLAERDTRPATLLVGSVSPRVASSARRAAESRGLNILRVDSRPLNAMEIEKLLTPHLSVAPPIPREEIVQALAEHELLLVYQPKLAIAGGVTKVQGLEALVRWQHPRRGLLQPRHFLGAVEECGLMGQLTDYVLTEAVAQAGRWRAHGLILEVIVNLSTKLVQDRGFPDRLGILLQENDFPAQLLVLDVTESASADDQSLLIDVFTRLRILGVGLSLDNFGTGLSSLTELYRMPFSEIKVDHALIADVEREHEARVIVKAVVNLAHALRLTVCAEGVESRKMFDFVRSVGFDSAQGRFFSEAVQTGEVEQLVRTWPSTGPAATGSWRRESIPDPDGSTTTIRALHVRGADGKKIK